MTASTVHAYVHVCVHVCVHSCAHISVSACVCVYVSVGAPGHNPHQHSLLRLLPTSTLVAQAIAFKPLLHLTVVALQVGAVALASPSQARPQEASSAAVLAHKLLHQASTFAGSMDRLVIPTSWAEPVTCLLYTSDAADDM
eukprot:2818568-Alexandrium_andersonii.AAC.1